MADIQHHIYGSIPVRRYRRSRYVRLSVATSGRLEISAPLYTPLYFIKHFVKKSDDDIARLLAQHSTIYQPPMQIGKSHWLELAPDANTETKVTTKKSQIMVQLASDDAISQPNVQHLIRQQVVKALRKEAKAYLPRRLDYLAERLGVHYQSTRFSHAKSRWGSCSSDGVISLNIALMTLDFELIDYVLIHELSHLREMNHSPQFWQYVAEHSPNYKSLRKTIKDFSPHI